MSLAEAGKPGMLDGLLKVFVLKLDYFATLGTNHMMVGVAVVTLLILGGVAKLVLDNQPGIDEQNNGIVKRGAAYPKVLVVGHKRIKRVDIKMSVNGINRVEYGIAFGRLAMSVRIKIFGEYLPDRIFYILIIHISNKVNSFFGKLRSIGRFFTPPLRSSPIDRANAHPRKKHVPSLPPSGTPDKHGLHYVP